LARAAASASSTGASTCNDRPSRQCFVARIGQTHVMPALRSAPTRQTRPESHHAPPRTMLGLPTPLCPCFQHWPGRDFLSGESAADEVSLCCSRASARLPLLFDIDCNRLPLERV
jgi:hypothetical protein